MQFSLLKLGDTSRHGLNRRIRELLLEWRKVKISPKSTYILEFLQSPFQPQLSYKPQQAYFEVMKHTDSTATTRALHSPLGLLSRSPASGTKDAFAAVPCLLVVPFKFERMTVKIPLEPGTRNVTTFRYCTTCKRFLEHLRFNFKRKTCSKCF